jgi:hypothetical protein
MWYNAPMPNQDFSAQINAGHSFNAFTGYIKTGPGSGFGPNWAAIIYFDTKTNALAAHAARSGTTRDHAGKTYYYAMHAGIECFFRWESEA